MRGRAFRYLVRTCDPDVMLLVSDHGSGPMEGHEFWVNDYLRDEGLVRVTGAGGGMPS